jgi:hypothetical protein
MTITAHFEYVSLQLQLTLIALHLKYHSLQLHFASVALHFTYLEHQLYNINIIYIYYFGDNSFELHLTPTSLHLFLACV